MNEKGCIPKALPSTADKFDEMKRKIGKALEKCDLLVLSGGTALGERDLTVNVIKELGKVLFHGIYIKPGKPTLCAVVKNKLVIVIPGNPTSCLTNGYVLLAPVLAWLAQRPHEERKITLPLADDIKTIKKSIQFVTVKITDGEAHSVYKSSSAITSMTYADGYIAVPRGVDVVKKGTMVDIMLF
jgi:molybdopterin biosynthesis enzyme